MQDLSSLTRDWTPAPCRGSTEFFNHWTTREVPPFFIFDHLGFQGTFPPDPSLFRSKADSKARIESRSFPGRCHFGQGCFPGDWEHWTWKGVWWVGVVWAGQCCTHWSSQQPVSEFSQQRNERPSACWAPFARSFRKARSAWESA